MSDKDGQVERSSAWVLTCESWVQQNCYIVFPINPTSLSFDIPVRTSNELTRAAQLIYVWRYMRTHSRLVMPTIKITANTGYIVPSFDPDLIVKCQTAVWKNSVAQSQGASVTSEQYDEFIQQFNHAPSSENTKDYISSGLYKQVGATIKPNASATDSGLASSGNIPDLYSADNKHVPLGVQNLYALFALADERRIRKTSTGQTENRVMLVISTPVFPRLTLWGWFGESGVSYTSSSEEGSFDVSFDFVVTETNPPLRYGNWSSLAETYKAAITENGTTLDWAKNEHLAT